MLFSAGAKGPTPSVINCRPLRRRRFLDLLKGETEKNCKDNFDRLDAHPLTGWGAGPESETTKAYRWNLLKVVRPEGRS